MRGASPHAAAAAPARITKATRTPRPGCRMRARQPVTQIALGRSSLRIRPSFRHNHHRACGAGSSMVRQNEWQFTNARGQKLSAIEVLPAGQPLAALVFHHGVCEHILRYLPVFEYLAEQGVAVYSFDAHGHGRSEPQQPSSRALVKRFADLLDDVDAFLESLKQRGAALDPGNTFMCGQSMGGLVAAQAVRRRPDAFAGLLVFSGAIGVVWTPTLRVQAAMGGLLAALIPRAAMVPVVEPKNLHPDPAVVKAYEEDPLVAHGPLRVSTANELLKGMNDLNAHAGDIKMPVYVVHGSKDAVTDPNAAKAFAGSVGSADVTFNLVDGGYHEMLIGDERNGSADGIVSWVKAHLKPSKL